MIFRWIYFFMVTFSSIYIAIQVWHRAGWQLGSLVGLMTLLFDVRCLHETLLKHWKMEEIITYKDIE